MTDYEAARDVWEFEKSYSLKPRAWISHAVSLRYSAEALLLYDEEVFDRIFRAKEQPRLPAFFSPNVERMLLGFSLENLFKALILMSAENARRAFAKQGNLAWSVASHDLLKLAASANVPLNREEEHLLDVLSTCAIWAGRYPLPMNEHQFPRRRKGAPHREMLNRRRRKEFERAMKAGTEILRCKHDQLHTNIGGTELDCYRQLFDRLLLEIETRGNNAP
ncbi:MAG: hypothetical protein NDI91_11110 [Sulfuritalea sp.]|nr:hypothetical protein [Sulfuritalea sp.]